MVEVKKEAPPETIKEIVGTLKKLQLELEPIRDKALDEKAKATGFVESTQQYLITSINGILREVEKRAKFEGYAKCAEDFLAIIVNRMDHLDKQVEATLKKEMESKVKNMADRFSAVEILEDEADQGELTESESSPA